eukprot:PhF_6_TR34615/c0_g1_i1/m.50397/K02871/RP-L13, MRPL13, rplM; large subunit ribosomal protein L13
MRRSTTFLKKLFTNKPGRANRDVIRPYKNDPYGLVFYNEVSKHHIRRDSERWWILDAQGMQMSKLAMTVSHYIQGRNRPDFEQGTVMGDHVVVLNCKDVVMIGEEWIRVPVSWQTDYPRGKYHVRCSEMYDKDPCMLVWHFIRRELIDRGYNVKQHMWQAHIEKAWLYADHVHPHLEKDPRPVPWSDHDPRYRPWASEHVHSRWKPNSQMR